MRLLVSALVAALITVGAAVGLVAAPAIAAPPPPRDTQVVRVLDSTGTPVEGAVLRFSDATAAPVTAAATVELNSPGRTPRSGRRWPACRAP